MARWKLLSAHYIFTNPPTEWEHKETDQMTGRQARKIYEVPRFVDPKEPSDYTNRADQEVVVCDGHNPGRGDIVFKGPPTPEMEPIDDEARRISASYAEAWRHHPIESLSGEVGPSWSDILLADLQRQVAELQGGRAIAAPVDTAAFAALQEQVAKLMEQNAVLMEKLSDRPKPSVQRRI